MLIGYPIDNFFFSVHLIVANIYFTLDRWDALMMMSRKYLFSEYCGNCSLSMG